MTDTDEAAAWGAVSSRVAAHRPRRVAGATVGLIAAVAGVLAVPSLVGSAGEEHPETVTAASVAEATLSVSSARIRSVVVVEGETTVNEGVIDLESGAAEIRFSFTGPDLDEPPEWYLTVDGESYTRSEATEEGWWVRLPYDYLDQDLDLSPTAIIDAFGDATSELVRIDTDVVRGEKTVTYRASMVLFSPTTALPLAGADATVTIDVDAEGRIRRAVIVRDDLEDRPPSEIPGDEWFLMLDYFELELWDFDLDVEIAPPDPAKVVDWDDPRVTDILYGEEVGLGPSTLEEAKAEVQDLIDVTVGALGTDVESHTTSRATPCDSAPDAFDIEWLAAEITVDLESASSRAPALLEVVHSQWESLGLEMFPMSDEHYVSGLMERYWFAASTSGTRSITITGSTGCFPAIARRGG